MLWDDKCQADVLTSLNLFRLQSKYLAATSFSINPLVFLFFAISVVEASPSIEKISSKSFM